MIRIITGKHRGRKLQVPPGQTVRPTASRVRESVFNILAHAPGKGGDHGLIQGAAVLDVCCGSAAMALEALSRGAAKAVCIDLHPAALDIARANARLLGEEGAVRFLKADATRLGPAPQPFDLVFIDPPYRKELAGPVLESLRHNGWLGAESTIVLELGESEPFTPPGGMEVTLERRYGAATIRLLRLAGDSA